MSVANILGTRIILKTLDLIVYAIAITITLINSVIKKGQWRIVCGKFESRICVSLGIGRTNFAGVSALRHPNE